MSDLLLAIDTSGPKAFVSIGNHKEILSLFANSDDSHNEELAFLVQSALESFGATPSSIGKVLLGVGPGSFTGLRIGLAFAKGVCQALAIPLFTISSLKLIASSVGHATQSEVCGAIFDARRDEVFCALYDRKSLEPLSEPAIKTFEDFTNQALSSNIKKSGTCVIGCWESSFKKDSIVFCRPEKVGEEAIRLFYENPNYFMMFDGEAKSLGEIEPSYLRAVSAQSIAERQAIKRS